MEGLFNVFFAVAIFGFVFKSASEMPSGIKSSLSCTCTVFDDTGSNMAYPFLLKVRISLASGAKRCVSVSILDLCIIV